MFIKKDLRRIEEILKDESDSKEILKLSKRAPEFNGNINIVCQERFRHNIINLKILNLYDNKLTTIHHIDYFQHLPFFEEINLGNNQLTQIPTEVC
jgi:Leucine-rich repeat (LRR) protein